MSGYHDDIEDIKKFNTAVLETIKSYLRAVITPECNQNCYWCHKEGLIRHELPLLTPNDWTSIFDAAFEAGFKKIRITGGEPFCYRNFHKILIPFINRFPYVGITTNGTLIKEYIKRNPSSREVFRKIYFNISLLSLNPLTYSKIAQCKVDENCIETIKENIKLVINSSEKEVKINIPCCHENINELSEMICFGLKIGVPHIKIVPVPSQAPDLLPRIMGIISKIGAKPRQGNLVQYQIFTLGNTSISIADSRLNVYGERCMKACNKKCDEGIYNIRVYYNGIISPCCSTKLDVTIKTGETTESIMYKLQKAKEAIKCIYLGFQPSWLIERPYNPTYASRLIGR